MSPETKQQKWIREHPCVWWLIQRIGDFALFTTKVYLAITIITLLKVIF